MTSVDRLYAEAAAVIEALGSTEPSLVVAAGDTLRKALVLAAASYFEARVTRCVLDFVDERASGDALVLSLVKNKAVNRQFHTWFSWTEKSASQFFGLFGADFKAKMAAMVQASDRLRGAIEAFLEMGNERNKMVHQDFATFGLEKTLDEIYRLYQQAMPFVEGLPDYLRDPVVERGGHE